MPASLAPDSEIVARCRRGDDAAWRELVDRTSRYLYAICRTAYSLSPAEADDVLQDAYTRAFTSLDKLRDDDALKPWLGQITRRLCVDRFRVRGRDGDTLDDHPDLADPDETLARLDEAMDVRAAMTELPEHCQEILDRFFAQDQTYREISAAVDIPAGTIASRISRCLTKLREFFTSS